MNMIASLHNESRRYCINNISYWGYKASNRYTEDITTKYSNVCEEFNTHLKGWYEN